MGDVVASIGGDREDVGAIGDLVTPVRRSNKNVVVGRNKWVFCGCCHAAGCDGFSESERKLTRGREEELGL